MGLVVGLGGKSADPRHLTPPRSGPALYSRSLSLLGLSNGILHANMVRFRGDTPYGPLSTLVATHTGNMTSPRDRSPDFVMGSSMTWL